MKNKKVEHSVGHLTLEIYKRSSIEHDEASILLKAYLPITLILNPRQCPEYTAQMEKDNFFCLIVDPRTSIKEINRFLKPLLAFKRKLTKTESKRKINERLKWIMLVDEIEKVNPTPTRKTFAKCFGNDPTAINRRIAEYCKGKILIKNPERYPLRSISNAEVRNYKIAHDLLIPHK